MDLLSYIFWDPDRVVFTIPGINRPVVWYGILFAFGFLVAFYLFRSLYRDRYEVSKKDATRLTEKFLLYTVVGTVIGARLGHLIFYEDFGFYLANPLEILKTWEGGLASHGGVVGILVALALFWRKHRGEYPHLSPLRILDLMMVPAMLIASCIRFGNFINQELLGTPTALPWGV